MAGIAAECPRKARFPSFNFGVFCSRWALDQIYMSCATAGSTSKSWSAIRHRLGSERRDHAADEDIGHLSLFRNDHRRADGLGHVQEHSEKGGGVLRHVLTSGCFPHETTKVYDEAPSSRSASCPIARLKGRDRHRERSRGREALKAADLLAAEGIGRGSGYVHRQADRQGGGVRSARKPARSSPRKTTASPEVWEAPSRRSSRKRPMRRWKGGHQGCFRRSRSPGLAPERFELTGKDIAKKAKAAIARK